MKNKDKTYQQVPQQDNNGNLSNRGNEERGLVSDLVGEVLYQNGQQSQPLTRLKSAKENIPSH